MSNVVELPVSDAVRARVVVNACAAAYAREPVVDNARDLVHAVQAWCDHLDALGVARRSRDAFQEMDASSNQDMVVLSCANAILRALRVAERRRDARAGR